MFSQGWFTTPQDVLHADWHDVFEAEYEALCGQVDAGAETLIDPYGTEDPVEFFAVAGEAFFSDPWRLREDFPALFDAMRRYFGQDPSEPAEGGPGTEGRPG